MANNAPPFKKILIANRGEIAESYLRIDALVAAATATGAEAVHPGFGFVSENSKFAEALADAGVTFIGPPVNAMAEMGDKLRSKEIAKAAGVNTIPGDERIMADADDALAAAKAIGFPVMLKASAGGGGKGMRIAHNEAEVYEGFASASNEARSSFGDDRMLVEKFIERPRHIEIQLIADQHGNVLYLNERECSIQRRHQKVIEEAPSPFVTPEVRKAMGEQSVALAQAVGYVSAGTVEFVVDPNHNFYFLEMNTRLQVEHPVTEFITGLDLVELMIRVAAGEKLPLQQSDVRLDGWAMEARIYAENPDRNFMPSTGRVQVYRPPEENEWLRNDTGIEEGSEISIYYDPMIAKLITAGETRNEARERLSDALDRFCIRGIQANISFLNALANHPQFTTGDMSTGFIAEHFPDGFASGSFDLPDNYVLPAVASVLQFYVDERSLPSRDGERAYIARTGSDELSLSVSRAGDTYTVTTADRSYSITTPWRPHDLVVEAVIDGAPFAAQLETRALSWHLASGGRVADVRVLTPRAAELLRLIPEKQPPDMSKFLLSPMPGLLVRLTVAEGDKVEAGQELAVIEAMKMENSLRAESDGVVSQALAEVGQNLEADQPILEFE